MPVLPEYSLEGKVAFVAGAGDGITPVLVGALAEAGAKVFIMATSQSVVEDGMWTVANLDGQALGLTGDPADPVAVERALEVFLPLWDNVDILINNARIPLAAPFQDMSYEDWNELMRCNVGSAFTLCHSVGREMLRRGGGKIINVISGLAERGLCNSVAFCASQGAVLQLTRALALEWALLNVRVNAVGLGWLSAKERAESEGTKDQLTRYIPLKRKGYPSDIAPLVIYLASDACQYTTGQPIYVDGGLMAHP